MKLRTDSLLAQFQFGATGMHGFRIGLEASRRGVAWIVPVEPFPFKNATAFAASQGDGGSGRSIRVVQEMVAASWDMELDWRLVPAVLGRVLSQRFGRSHSISRSEMSARATLPGGGKSG